MYRKPAERPRSRLPLLGRISVKTPCNVPWDSMEGGDDRTRFCGECSKSVHDLSAMTEDEAEAFLDHHLDDEDLCIRLYRRPDGTILTSDCPRGRRTRHVRRVAIATAATATALAATAAMVGDLRLPRTQRTTHTHSRFEVPRRPVPPPPPLSEFPGRDDAHLDPFAAGYFSGGIAWHPQSSELERLKGVDPPPRLRQTEVTVAGPLPAEVVQRIVRQSLGRLRLCYEEGLRRKPDLSGQVSVLFVIDPTGAVASAEDHGSQLADSKVVSCIVRSFQQLSFPEPEGKNKVTALYSMAVSPPEPDPSR
jgi:hypothetical protein